MTDLMLWCFDKVGIINTIIIFVWLCFFISFVGVYLSYRNFTENCVIGKAVVYSYVDSKVDEAPTIYVKLLDIENSEIYPTRFSGSEKKYAVGTEIDVAYKKTKFDYDIRLADKQGKFEVILMFIFQIIPFIVLVVYNLVSLGII